MATFTVTTAADVVADDGQLSLREAVAQANATSASDTINFAAPLEGETLFLIGGELTVRQDLRINGEQVTLVGGGLNIADAGTDVHLDDLTVTNGSGIFLGGERSSLAMTDCTVRSNFVGYLGRGGGIYAAAGSRLTLSGCSIVENQADIYGFGGGIATGYGVALAIRDSQISDNHGNYGGGIWMDGGTLVIEDSIVSGNSASSGGDGYGGGLFLTSSTATIARSTISNNFAEYGSGGIYTRGSNHLTLTDSTVAGNYGNYTGGGIFFSSGTLTVRDSTITGNGGEGFGGIFVYHGQLSLANSIVAGNTVEAVYAVDIHGAITWSNGHNIFGSDVDGAVAGDRENIAASAIFAAIDPDTGGGQLNAAGVVPLRNSLANPALNGGDPLAALTTDQLGTTRPLPAGSLPDIGAAERNQALSTTASANNDVLTGTAAADALSGLAGADILRGLGGDDTLNGGAGSDLLRGGAGNNQLNGGTGIDLASFAGGTTAVVVDLSGASDTATRGSETDTLTGIEGAIGSMAATPSGAMAPPTGFRAGRARTRTSWAPAATLSTSIASRRARLAQAGTWSSTSWPGPTGSTWPGSTRTRRSRATRRSASSARRPSPARRVSLASSPRTATRSSTAATTATPPTSSRSS